MGTYKISFDLSNLNRTADYVLQKNAVARSTRANPYQEVFDDLLEPVRKIVATNSMAQIMSDVKSDVVYYCQRYAGMGVVFHLDPVTVDKRLMNAPSVVVQEKSEQYLHAEIIETNDSDKFDVTFTVQYFAALGKDLVSSDPIPLDLR